MLLNSIVLGTSRRNNNVLARVIRADMANRFQLELKSMIDRGCLEHSCAGKDFEVTSGFTGQSVINDVCRGRKRSLVGSRASSF